MTMVEIRPRLSPEEYEVIKLFRAGKTDFSKHLAERGIDPNEISSYWDKTKSYSINIKKNPENWVRTLGPEFFETILADASSNLTEIIKIPKVSGRILRVILTDIHIGMDNSKGLYDKPWGLKQLRDRMNIVKATIKEYIDLYQDFDEIHLIDLGDLLDGWNKKTTRGDHELDQNLDNKEAFKAAISCKIDLVSYINSVSSAGIVMHNICNDNHAGDFGAIANISIEGLCKLSFPTRVKVFNHEAFFNHYRWHDHVFVLSHGKDKLYCRSGLPTKIDQGTFEKIDEYVRQNNLNKKGYNVIFEKGDSHQRVLDDSKKHAFGYHSYSAFSPSSAWVQHNFKLGSSGFDVMVVEKGKKSVKTHPIWFD